jgi:hypothetical protein
MTSGSLTDLDPAPAPERRWPFYVAWTMGGLVVGAVLATHLPVSRAPLPAPVAVPAEPAPPIPTFGPAPLRQVIPVPWAPGTPLRAVPVHVAPGRP